MKIRTLGSDEDQRESGLEVKLGPNYAGRVVGEREQRGGGMIFTLNRRMAVHNHGKVADVSTPMGLFEA